MNSTPFARTLGPYDGLDLGHEYILVVMPVTDLSKDRTIYKWYAFDMASVVVCNGEADDQIEAFINAKSEIRAYDHKKCRETFRSYTEKNDEQPS